MKFNKDSRCVSCNDHVAHLSKNFWNLLIRLVHSQTHVLTFSEACLDDAILGVLSIWDENAKPEDSSLRSMASRLSARLLAADIPYRVRYSQVSDSFILLVSLEMNSDGSVRHRRSFTRIPKHDETATSPHDEMQKSLNLLTSLLPKNVVTGVFSNGISSFPALGGLVLVNEFYRKSSAAKRQVP